MNPSLLNTNQLPTRNELIEQIDEILVKKLSNISSIQNKYVEPSTTKLDLNTYLSLHMTEKEKKTRLIHDLFIRGYSPRMINDYLQNYYLKYKNTPKEGAYIELFNHPDTGKSMLKVSNIKNDTGYTMPQISNKRKHTESTHESEDKYTLDPNHIFTDELYEFMDFMFEAPLKRFKY